jgi:hypothetical protein
MAVAKGAVTMSWKPEELLDAFALRPEEARTLIGFREEFEKLTSSSRASNVLSFSWTTSTDAYLMPRYRP